MRFSERLLNYPEVYIKSLPRKIMSLLTNKQYCTRMDICKIFILEKKDELIAENPAYGKYIDYLMQNDLTVFCDDFEDKYNYIEYNIQRDRGYPYVELNEKRVYYPAKFNLASVRENIRQICCEQDISSPHRYLDSDESLEDYIVFDCGAAEASLMVEHIEEIKHLYLFEADNKWNKPLKLSFEKWSEKVSIINKYVTNKNSDDTVSLKNYILKLHNDGVLNYREDKIFIKMDIEGAETEVLRDIQELLIDAKNIKLAICVYHNNDDEDKVFSILPEFFSRRVREGYMLFWADEEIAFPYFRHGVIRSERI